VLERARGLLDVRTAYDYVFRASRHPSAAQNRLQAGGTIALGDIGAEAAPLPRFDPEALGDCIDCTLCVQVCPVGIDIRNGLQYECIACGACIDACDGVMDKVGYPRGLIRYTTQNAIDGRPTRVLRPRVAVYGALLALLVAGFAWGVAARSPLIVEALRDRNALYRETADGIENGYTLKVANKTERPQRYRVRLDPATPGLQLAGGSVQVDAAAAEVLSLPLVVVAPASVGGRHEVAFVVETLDGRVRERAETTFFGPM
jgi:cytochrome c oxidase accessory protein FixG